MANLEARKLVSDAITALHTANVDFMVSKLQTKNW
jgi:hypothetical protein